MKKSFCIIVSLGLCLAAIKGIGHSAAAVTLIAAMFVVSCIAIAVSED